MGTPTHGHPLPLTPKPMGTHGYRCSPSWAPISTDAYPHGQPNPWAPTLIDTQTHGHPLPLTPKSMDTHPYGCSPPWVLKPMGTQNHRHPNPRATQPVHPPSQAPTSAAPTPTGTPPQGVLTLHTHPHGHPPSWTPTSPHRHPTPPCTHLPRRSRWQTLTPTGTLTSWHPHRWGATSPVGTHTTAHPRQHPPTHPGLLILGLVVAWSSLQGNPHGHLVSSTAVASPHGTKSSASRTHKANTGE